MILLVRGTLGAAIGLRWAVVAMSGLFWVGLVILFFAPETRGGSCRSEGAGRWASARTSAGAILLRKVVGVVGERALPRGENIGGRDPPAPLEKGERSCGRAAQALLLVGLGLVGANPRRMVFSVTQRVSRNSSR